MTAGGNRAARCGRACKSVFPAACACPDNFAAIFALLLANSPLADIYSRVLGLNLTITVEGFGVSKPLLLWINDGLMAVFFLLVGLELKREIVEGQLSSPDQIVLPALAAIGGLAVPAV